MSACHWSIGEYGAALAAAERNVALAREPGDTSLRVYGNVALTWIHHSLGDYAAGARSGRDAVKLLGGDQLTMRLPIPSASRPCSPAPGSCRVWSSWASSARPRSARTRPCGWPRRSVNHGASPCRARVGVYRLRRSDPAEAARALERASNL